MDVRPTTDRWAPGPPPPAGPAAGVEYAGFWIRVLATVIDTVILGVLGSVLSGSSGDGTVITGPDGTFSLSNHGPQGFSTLLGFVYAVAFWTWRGQTPGKMALGLRIVRAEDGGPIDIGRAVLRYVGLVISFAVLLLGVIWVGFDPRRQGWHDKIAGTFVIRAT